MDPSAIAANVSSIFSLPEAVSRVNELIDSGNASSIELEQVISSDPALTAKLLKFANSSYFGFSGKVATVPKAISIVGHKELRNLVIAASVTSTFKGIPAELVDMDIFWNHSITCGGASRTQYFRLYPCAIGCRASQAMEIAAGYLESGRESV